MAGIPAAVGVAGVAVVAGAAGVTPTSLGILPTGTEVAVGCACDSCGIRRTGSWGPRTGAVLAARSVAAKRRLSGGAEYDRGRAMGYAVCKRGEIQDDVPLVVPVGQFARGWTDGVMRCREEHRSARATATRGSLDPAYNYGM